MHLRPMESESLLPLLVEPQSVEERSPAAFGAWLEEQRDDLRSRLLRHGGLLFRGYSLSTAEDMHAAVLRSDPQLLNYTEGQSQRRKILDRVYNSTEYPPQYDITMHNELSYSHKPPSRIYFFCKTAPSEGGQTPIVDCRRVLQELDPSIRKEFAERGVRYVKTMHGGGKLGGKSWQEHFETDDRSAVEDYLRKGSVEFEWLPGGYLRTAQVRPAVIRHPVSGEELWFNQASLWHVSNFGSKAASLRKAFGDFLPTQATFGDGGQIPEESLARIRELTFRLAVHFPWRPGDLLMLDNFSVAHGRRSFKGDRLILVAMA